MHAPADWRVVARARHGDAKRRREELFKERSLAVATKTGYPFDFQTKRIDHGVKGVMAPAKPPPMFESGDIKRFTPEELAEATRRCQDRIHSAREKEFQTRRLQWQQEQEKQLRSEMAGHEAPRLAAKRLRDRKVKARQAQEENINSLITQQPSSIEAMNIARMLSPRFEERVMFTPSVARNSVEDERIKHLLENARVGSYYQ